MSEPLPPPERDPATAEKTTAIQTTPIVSRDLADLGTPGVWIEVDPDVAEEMGAFEETAVSLADVEDDEGGE